MAPSLSGEDPVTVVAVSPGQPSELQLENEIPILVVSSDGEQVQIDLRNNIPSANSVLTVTLLSPEFAPRREQNRQIESIILEVVLSDGFGNEVNTFPEEVELCFSVEGGTSGKCLGFFDESGGEWKCTDPCLKKKQNLICGTTDHFTNFAILLTGGEEECGETTSYVISWLSMAFIIFAILVIAIAVGLIERDARKRANKIKNTVRAKPGANEPPSLSNSNGGRQSSRRPGRETILRSANKRT